MAEDEKLITVENSTDADIHIHGHGNLPAHREAAVSDNDSVQEALGLGLLKRHNRKPRADDDKETGA